MGLCLLLLGLSEVRVVPPPRSHLGICYLHSHTWEALSSDPSVAFVHPVSSARKQDWALTVVGAPFHFFFPNKGHFHSQFYLKYPLRGFLWRNSPFSWWGKHAELPALGRSQGRLCSLLLFVLGGSLIKGESIWWWLVICHEEEQRDVSKPQTSGWLPVGRLHSLGTRAGRRMLGWHQGLVCDTFTWVLPRALWGVWHSRGRGVQQLPRFAPVAPDLHQLGEPWFKEKGGGGGGNKASCEHGKQA